MVGDERVKILPPPPRRSQQRSQPAVYQLHLVQDLRFLTLLNPTLTRTLLPSLPLTPPPIPTLIFTLSIATTSWNIWFEIVRCYLFCLVFPVDSFLLSACFFVSLVLSGGDGEGGGGVKGESRGDGEVEGESDGEVEGESDGEVEGEG
jgi:hypothetical protein